MLNKSLSLAVLCSLLLSCVLCSCSSGPSEKPADAAFSFFDIEYTVPASWNSSPDEATDPSTPYASSMHSSPDADVDLVVERFRLDYSGPWSYVEEDPNLASEYLASADYDANGATIPGFWYKADDGALVYLYELTYDEAYYRLTFTLRGSRDDLLPQVHAVLDSLRSV